MKKPLCIRIDSNIYFAIWTERMRQAEREKQTKGIKCVAK